MIPAGCYTRQLTGQYTLAMKWFPGVVHSVVEFVVESGTLDGAKIRSVWFTVLCYEILQNVMLYPGGGGTQWKGGYGDVRPR